MKNLFLPFNRCLLLLLLMFPFFHNEISAQTFQTQNGGRQRIVFEKNSLTARLSGFEHQIFEMINQKRTENGLEPLIWNDQIAAVARRHSENMAQNGFFSHTGLDGKEVDDRAEDMGLRKWRMIGENIAYNRGYDNPLEQAVEGWMRSPGHRQNILRSNWKESGIGIAVSTTGQYYFTQVFLRRK